MDETDGQKGSIGHQTYGAAQNNSRAEDIGPYIAPPIRLFSGAVCEHSGGTERLSAQNIGRASAGQRGATEATGGKAGYQEATGQRRVTEASSHIQISAEATQSKSLPTPPGPLKLLLFRESTAKVEKF